MTRLSVFHILTVVILVVLAGCGGASFDALTGPDRAAAETDESPHTGARHDAERERDARGPLSQRRPGASTLVVGPSNETMLIDSGDWSDDGEDVLSYLEGRDIDRIDYLVTTHADADHIGGHAAIIEHFETEGDGVGAVYDPGIASSSQTYGRYLDAVEEHDVTLYETRSGDTIPFEGVETTVLMPPEEYVANGDRNENSVALHLGFGESSFLLPGDTEDAGEEFLVDEYGGFTEHNGVAGRPPRESLQFERRLPRGEPAADSVDFERLRLPVRSPPRGGPPALLGSLRRDVLDGDPRHRSDDEQWVGGHGGDPARRTDRPAQNSGEGRRSNPVPLTTCRCGLSST